MDDKPHSNANSQSEEEDEVHAGFISIVLATPSTHEDEETKNLQSASMMMLKCPTTTVPSLLSSSSSIILYPETLARQSCYVSALLDSGMMESRSRRIDLTHLDPSAVKTVLRLLEDQEASFESLLWSGFQGLDLEHMMSILKVFDYLQVKDSDKIARALLALYGQDGIRSICIEQGWIDRENGRVLSIPSNRKKRYWRFWVCFFLCMNLMPEADTPLEQAMFTEMIEPFSGNAGVITFRREMIEYCLIVREFDGSFYWRPKYTAKMMEKWLDGMPRSII